MLMRHSKIVEMNLRSPVTLIVVTRFEVAVRTVKIKGIQVLKLSVVNLNREIAVLVTNLISESFTDGNLTDSEALLAAGEASVDAHLELAAGAIVQFTDRLGGDAAIDLDLADGDTLVGNLLDDEIRAKAISRVSWTPLSRIVFSKLCPAVFAVGRGDAVGRRGRALNDHDHGIILSVGVKVLTVVAVASLQIPAGNGRGLAGRPSWEL